MSKTAWAINRPALENAIREAETKRPSNYTDMLKKSADLYNGKYKTSTDREITFSVVGLRIDALGIITSTPKRKRECGPRKPKDINGNPITDGSGSVDESGNRIPDPFPTATATQRAKSAEKPIAKQIDKYKDPFIIMRKRTPDLYHGLIDKIERGSKASALKLNCLTCAGFVRIEVKDCRVYGCPVWPVRPYQTKADSEPGEDEEVNAGTSDQNYDQSDDQSSDYRDDQNDTNSESENE